MNGICIERRPPFEDDVVRYWGQYVALAVADTFESAKAAADAVAVAYATEKPNVDFKLTAEDDPDEVMTSYGPAKRLQSERGDAAGAFASAPVKLDQTYVTPAETHVPIELQGTTAMWDGDKLTIYEESQGVFNMRGGTRPNVRFAERERSRHHQVCWLRFRQQTLAVDTLSAGGGGGASGRQTGQARA